MAVIFYVALPFVRTEEGIAPGEAQEMPNEQAAIRRANRCHGTLSTPAHSRSSAAATRTWEISTTP